MKKSLKMGVDWDICLAEEREGFAVGGRVEVAEHGSDGDRTPQQIAEVAGNLQISEFQLFKTAYCAWYGRTTTDRMIEPLFLDYMFRERVPSWVRHFVRKLSAGADPLAVIPVQCTIERRKVDSSLRARGWAYLSLVLIVLLLFCAMLILWFPAY